MKRVIISVVVVIILLVAGYVFWNGGGQRCACKIDGKYLEYEKFGIQCDAWCSRGELIKRYMETKIGK